MKVIKYLWKYPPIFAGVLTVSAMLINLIVWWVKVNGFSFTGKYLNHFGEYLQGNFLLWLFVGTFLFVFTATIFVYFIGFLILLYLVKFFCKVSQRRR